MNPKKAVSPTASFANSLYRPVGGGDAKKGPPASLAKPVDIYDFEFSGEPQDLNDDINLSTPVELEDTSYTRSTPSQQQFFNSEFPDDGSRSADMASADEPEPVPAPANTPPGPAQPTVQLSDDPAIAALQKSTLAATVQVVLFTQCLAILENALANPQCKLPPNSFSYMRGLFSNSIKYCETRAQELTTQTEQLLAQDNAKAKALAAQAESGASPVVEDTFSARASRAQTDMDLKQVRQELQRLPDAVLREKIIGGLRVALTKEDTITEADLDRELHQMQWDLNNPTMEGVDPEIGELYKQLQMQEAEPVKEKSNAEVEALEQLGKDLNNIQFPAEADEVSLDDLDFTSSTKSSQSSPKTPPYPSGVDELDALIQDLDSVSGASITHTPALTRTTSQPPTDLDTEQNALLEDIENGRSPVDSKSNTSGVIPSQIPPTQDDLTKPVKLSPDELIAISHEGVRRFTSEMAKLGEEIERVRNREFTPDEKNEHQKFLKGGGSSAEFRKKLVKRELVDIVRNFQAAQNKAIDRIQETVLQIGAYQLMNTASQHARQLHLKQLQGEKETLQQLIDTGDRMIRSF